MFQKIKSFFGLVYDKLVNLLTSLKNKINRHWKPILIISIIVSIIILTIALVMYSFKSVQALSNGVLVNWTQKKIIGGKYSNQILFTGLGSGFIKTPKNKILISFGNQQIFGGKKENKQNSIQARVAQGTKLQIFADVQCEINPNNLRDFLEDYGEAWLSYLIEKSKNVIIQEISKTKFYEVTNKNIIKTINKIFESYLSNDKGYPFKLQIINMKIKYPQGSYSVTNSLGNRLLNSKSTLSQLKAHYSYLLSDLTQYKNQISSLSIERGQIEGKIKGKKLLTLGSGKSWLIGLSKLRNMLNNKNKYMDQFLWLYFQNTYNQTYHQN